MPSWPLARKLYPERLEPVLTLRSEGSGAAGARPFLPARIEYGVIIDPAAVIGPRAAIGMGTVIGATAVIGPDVHIGRDCSIGPGASIIHALIGDSVIIHPGRRIGQDDSGSTPVSTSQYHVTQLVRVIVRPCGDRANTTIDRGASGDTFVGEGTKIDNLVELDIT